MPTGVYKHQPLSQSAKIKLSRFFKGRKLTPEHKNLIKLHHARYWLGKHRDKATRIKISENNGGFKKGKLNKMWRGGITKTNIKIRMGIEYRLWREAVFARDNWTCQKCHKRGLYIEAHHIKEFSNYPELRFAIDNGMTLCKKCHNKTKKGRKNE